MANANHIPWNIERWITPADCVSTDVLPYRNALGAVDAKVRFFDKTFAKVHIGIRPVLTKA